MQRPKLVFPELEHSAYCSVVEYVNKADAKSDSRVSLLSLESVGKIRTFPTSLL